MDPKVRVGNRILIFARVWAIIMTIAAIITGIVLIIVGFATKTRVSTGGYYGGTEEVPNYGMVWAGFICFPSIFFIWIIKLFIDGYGLIVIANAKQLKDSSTITYIDEVYKKKIEARRNHY